MDDSIMMIMIVMTIKITIMKIGLTSWKMFINYL